MICKKPVNGVWTIHCPCCNAPRLQVRPDSMEVVGSRYWLSDGDTISALWAKLSEAQKARNDFDYEMLVGECPSCGGSYYVADVAFMAGERELIEDHLHGNIDPISSAYFQCSLDVPIEGVPVQGMCEVNETTQGPMHRHTFGPFVLASKDGVVGPFGVSACQASSNEAWDRSAHILLTLWEELRQPFEPACEAAS